MTYYYELIYPVSATRAKQTVLRVSEKELESDILNRLEDYLIEDAVTDNSEDSKEVADLRKDQAIISNPNLSFASKFSALKDAYDADDQLVVRVQDKHDLDPEKTVEFF